MAQEAAVPDDQTILWSDEGTLILTDSFNTQVNRYTLLCPGYGSMRDLYAASPDVAVMFADYEDRAEMTGNLIANYEMAVVMLKTGYNDARMPTYDNGMIAPDGKFLSAGNTVRMIPLQEEALAAPGEMQGASLNNPENIEKMRRYADNYCHARY